MENMIDVPMKDVRDIKTITAEIRTLTRQAQKMILNYAIEVGHRLCEAKSMLPHGQWGDYLKNEVEFSQSTANNFMKIFEEYGADQMTLDGAVAKSQTLGNLTYSKALKLLAVPAEEREEFVKAHDVEDMSTRELERAIKERDAAKEALQTAQRECDSLQTALDDGKKAAAALEAELKRRSQELAQQLKQVQKEEKEAQEALQAAKKEMEKLSKKPTVSDEELGRIKKEAMGEAKKELEKRALEDRAQMDKLETAVKNAQAEATRAAAEAEKLRKQLAMANTEATVFKVHFEGLQEGFNKLYTAYLRIEAAEPEQAEKLKKAMRAVVESFQKRLEG